MPSREPQGDVLFFSPSEPQKSQGRVLACGGFLVAPAPPHANLTCKEIHLKAEAYHGRTYKSGMSVHWGGDGAAALGNFVQALQAFWE